MKINTKGPRTEYNLVAGNLPGTRLCVIPSTAQEKIKRKERNRKAHTVIALLTPLHLL
jgi:hypothetical protein